MADNKKKSKTALYNEVSENVTKLLEANEVDSDIIAEVQKAIDASLKPGQFGAVRVNLDEITKKDSDGNITEIKCSLSGAWLPADTEYFYEDLSGKSKLVNADGVALKRWSKQAEAIKKKFAKEQAKKSQEISAKVLKKEISIDEGNALFAELAEEKPDYSVVRA